MFQFRMLFSLVLAAALVLDAHAEETKGRKRVSKSTAAAPKPSPSKDAAKTAKIDEGYEKAAQSASTESASETSVSEKEAGRPMPSKFTSGPKSSGAVSFTFDDGPHPTLTPQLLETLKGLNIKATFFMLGNMVEQNPGIAKAVAEAGHEVANHSFSHRDMTKMPEGEIRKEVQRTQEAIEAATGRKPVYFRPPYGSINAKVLKILQEEGLEAVTWSVDPRDWDKKVTTEKLIQTIGGQSVAGSILCLHDIHARTVQSVPAMAEAIKAKGLGFATAGELVTQMKEAIVSGKADSGHVVAEDAPVSSTPRTIPLGKSAPPRPASSTPKPAEPKAAETQPAPAG